MTTHVEASGVIARLVFKAGGSAVYRLGRAAFRTFHS